MNKAGEFFQGDNGAMSMSRLLMFGAFIVTSVIMFKVQMNEGYFSMYIGAWAGSYLASKGIDAKTANKGTP